MGKGPGCGPGCEEVADGSVGDAGGNSDHDGAEADSADGDGGEDPVGEPNRDQQTGTGPGDPPADTPDPGGGAVTALVVRPGPGADPDHPWLDDGDPEGLAVETAESVDRARDLAATDRVEGVVVLTGGPDGRVATAVESVREVAPEVPVVLVADGGTVPAAAVAAGVEDCLTRSEAADPGTVARRFRDAVRGGTRSGPDRGSGSATDESSGSASGRTTASGRVDPAGSTGDPSDAADEGRTEDADHDATDDPTGRGDAPSGAGAESANPDDGSGGSSDDAGGVVGIPTTRIGAGDRVPESLTTLFETVPMPVAETKVVDDEAVVVEVNPAFEETFGHDASTAVGESLDDLVVPEGRRESAAELTRRSATGDRLDVQVRRETPEGLRDFILRFAPLSGEDDPVRGYAIYVDVTDRTEYERVVTRLHDVSRELMAAETPEEIAEIGVSTARDTLGLPYASIHLYDAAEGMLRPAAVSDASLEAFGSPPPFEPGQGIAGKVFEDGEPLLLDDAQEDERKREGGPSEIRSYYVIPMGDVGIMTVSSPRVGDVDERDADVAGILAGNVHAALRRADREAQLRRSEREVRRQNERLDRVASVIGHDLRNPIEVAKANLALARTDEEDPAPDQDRLAGVDAALDRMAAIVEDALELARQGESVVDPAAVEFDEVVRRAWGAVDAPQATLRGGTGRSFPADEPRLQRLLENLFRNAVEHGGEDVTVTVEALPGGFAVADDGPGIDPEDRDAVFEPGYSTDPDGTGLGLNIAREIADAHDWSIAVADAETGARIEVTGIDPTDDSA